MYRPVFLSLALCFTSNAFGQTPLILRTGLSTSGEPANVYSLQIPGVARPQLSADARCLVPGTVEKVLVNEGQAVKAGDALVSLDDRLVQAQLKVAESEAKRSGELYRAKIQLTLAESQLARLQSAFERKAISEFEMEDQRARVEQARALHQTQLEAKELAKAKLRLVAEQLRQLTVFAPFDGVVSQVHTKLGASADPTSPVVTIVNLDSLEIELHVPIELYGKLRIGGHVELAAGRPVSKTIEAEVASTSSVINSASNTFRCVLKVENARQQLPAGFSVTLAPPAHIGSSLHASQN